MTQTEPVVELDEPGRWRGGDSRQSPGPLISFLARIPHCSSQTGSFSFLPLGPLSAAAAGQINDVGDAQGFVDGNSMDHVIIWVSNGIHDLGPAVMRP